MINISNKPPVTYSMNKSNNNHNKVSFGKLFQLKCRVDGKTLDEKAFYNKDIYEKAIHELIEKLHGNDIDDEIGFAIREKLFKKKADYCSSEQHGYAIEDIMYELGHRDHLKYYLDRSTKGDEMRNEVNKIIKDRWGIEPIMRIVVSFFKPDSNERFLATGLDRRIISSSYDMINSARILNSEKFEGNDILDKSMAESIIENASNTIREIFQSEKSWIKDNEVLFINLKSDRSPGTIGIDYILDDIDFGKNDIVRKLEQ